MVVHVCPFLTDSEKADSFQNSNECIFYSNAATHEVCANRTIQHSFVWRLHFEADWVETKTVHAQVKGLKPFVAMFRIKPFPLLTPILVCSQKHIKTLKPKSGEIWLETTRHLCQLTSENGQFTLEWREGRGLGGIYIN